jgi:hypothetical protein
LVFSVSATDPDHDALTLSGADLPTGATFTDNTDGTGEFRWTPGFDQAANFEVTLIVTDSGSPSESDAQTFTISVGDVNRPPVLATIGNRSTDIGVQLNIPMTAADPEGDALSLSAANLPDGARFEELGNGTAEFIWTPSADQTGNHAVTFTATDLGSPAAADSEEITITVGEINRPPTLAPIGDRKVLAEESLTIVITASDPDGDPLEFGSDGVPDGARFTDFGDGTAELTWVPRLDQLGRHDVTVTVSDSDSVEPGESDMESFAIHVDSKLAELPAVELEARWKCRRSRLEVKARDLPVRTVVRIYDATTGERLGKRISNRRGKVHFRKRLQRAPISVQIEWDVNGTLVRTAPVLVEGPDERCNRRFESHDGRDDYRVEMMRLLKKWMEGFR